MIQEMVSVKNTGMEGIVTLNSARLVGLMSSFYVCTIKSLAQSGDL